ncbi:MAG TPA: GNAT family N-acetyltransferase [Gemmatimonadota bacterium]|nr:GNAT family N-acetyltransferase [Gemmatimonadota bacterium]
MNSSEARRTPETGGYFLRSVRLGFRAWTPADLEQARALWGDDRVTRLIGGPFSDEEIRERLAAEIANGGTLGIQYWPIFRLDDGAFVGCCGFRPHPATGGFELGFHLLPEHWGRGYAAEAARSAIDYAFASLGAETIHAGHHPENTRSGALLERLGLRRIGEELYPPTGRFHPTYRFDRENYDKRVP